MSDRDEQKAKQSQDELLNQAVKTAKKLSDVHNQNTLNSGQPISGNQQSPPSPTSGQDLSASTTSGTNTSQAGKNIGSTSQNIGGTATPKPEVAGTTGAATSEAGSAVATTGSAGAAGSAGATAGTAVGAGAATGGIGAIVVLALAALKTTADKANAEFNSLWKQTDTAEDLKGPGFIGLLILVICIMVYSVIAVPQAIYNVTVDQFMEAGTDFLGVVKNTIIPSEKRIFFEEIFGTDSLDMTLNNRIEAYKRVDHESVEVYKKIIDHAIDTSLTEKIGAIIANPLDYISLDSMPSIDDYSEEKSVEYLKGQPYPYSLKHPDGSYYTMGDFLDGNIPENELHNDLNYAEIIAVIGQKKGNVNMFTYSNFYDLLLNERNYSLYYEANSEIVYFFEAVDGTVYEDTDKDVIETTMAQKEEEANAAADNAGDANNANAAPSPTPSAAPAISYELHWYIQVNLYPYGLQELYGIIETDPHAKNATFSTKTNYEILDYNEQWIIETVKGNDLGTTFMDKRSKFSHVYDKITAETTELATGRSLWNYIDDSFTQVIIGIHNLPEWDLDNIPMGNMEYDPTGESVILEMYGYINQGDYKDAYRGQSTETIANSGCCDCSYTMIAQYYHREEISIRGISRAYVVGTMFQTPTFLSAYGLTQNQEEFSMTSIVNYITQGTPLVFHISGIWTYNGVTYHRTTNGHFLVIMGYDETGLYVYDPGSRSNTQNSPIPYEAFNHVNGKYIRPVHTTANDFTPFYQVNTIANPEG